ncbi:PKD domain-containing protein [Pedobacter sp. MW01-1-1]|uniref:PKD domain-containing protein n=1 Tax=Pedobacter sp. MW01-1-1 TaxID=3383027 RepID=UPI003FEE03BE
MAKFLLVNIFRVLLLFAAFTASAQNCTVNAGVNQTLCSEDPFTLVGTATGSFSEPAKWVQISGPAVTVSASTTANNQVTASVTGYAKGISYTFRLEAKCSDGTPVYNDVVYKMSAVTIANAGPSVTLCPGVYTMTANALQPGETGLWVVVNGSLPLPSPSNSPTATVTLPQGSAIGTTIYRWRVSDADCFTTSEMSITNTGAVSPVTASGPAIVSCYSVTGSANITGSNPGSGLNQQGTWSFISGPSTPTFGNIHNSNTTLGNLIGGTYVVRWTVSGDCVNGSADVTIVVDPPSQDVTGVSGYNQVFCDTRTSTQLVASKPLYTNETGLWVAAASNPTTTTFSDASSPTTTVSGLNGSGHYRFDYTITNSVTNCSRSGTFNVRYVIPPQFTSFPSSPQVLPTDTTRYNIQYTVSGGDGTDWQLVEAPAGSIIVDSVGLNTTYAGNDTDLLARGMTIEGTYTFRFRRYSTNSAVGGCEDVFRDLSIIVSKTPYQSNAGTSQFLACNVTTATLAGNNPQSGDSGSGTWTQISGPNTAIIVNPHSNSTIVTGLVSGLYVFRWIISGGQNPLLNNESDVNITVANAAPGSANAGANIAACYGTPINLNANVPLTDETGTWSVVSETPAVPASTLVFSDIHDPKAIVTGLLPFKTYTLRWTIANACSSIFDDVEINTSAANGPAQADAGDDQCLPSGTSTFTLSANTPGSGEIGIWTLLPGSPNTPVFDPNASSQTVTGAVVGNYRFEWRLERGTCAATRDTVSITISAPTTAASITGAPLQNICGITPLTITGNTPGPNEMGTWTQTGGYGGAVIANPNSPTTTVSGLTTGTYKFRWTITNNACSSSYAEIVYNVSESPTTANAGAPQSVCNANTTTLAANVPTVGIGTWSVIGGPTSPSFANINDPQTVVSGLSLGVYTLRWSVANGVTCPPSTSDVIITVGQSANAGVDQALCDVGTTSLVGNEGSTGTWSQTAGPPVTITQNSNNSATVSGMVAGNSYTFRYTLTANVCGTPSDDVVVSVSGSPSVAQAGPDQNLCTDNGTSVTLAATAAVSGTGVWTIETQPSGAAATFVDASNPATLVNNLTVSGTYLFKWTVSANNCAGNQSNNDIMRVDVSLPPTVVEPMPTQNNQCTTSVILTGTTPVIGIGTWTNISGPNIPTIDAPNSPTTTVSGLSIGTYVFRWTITNGSCTPSFKEVTVGVVDVAPPVAVAGTISDQCTASIGGQATATLNATPVSSPNQGSWSVVAQPVGSPAVVFSSASNPNATASNLVAGDYTFRWLVYNSSICTTSSEVSFKVYDPPSTADAGGESASYCLYSPVTLSAIAPTSGTGTWTVVTKPSGASDPVFSNVNDPNATVTGLLQGTYVFRWTTSNGPCATNSDDITVVINDCQIAISKDKPSTPVQQADGSYNVTFVFHVKNTGTVAVGNIQVTDDLTTTFPSPKTFTKVSLVSTGGLATNSGFTGNTDQNLLNAAGSNLAAGVEETVTLVINVRLN